MKLNKAGHWSKPDFNYEHENAQLNVITTIITFKLIIVRANTYKYTCKPNSSQGQDSKNTVHRIHIIYTLFNFRSRNHYIKKFKTQKLTEYIKSF